MMERFYTRNQIIEFLGIGSSTLQRMMSEDLPYIKLRGRVLFKKDEVKNYLVEHSHNHRLETFSDVVG